MTGPDDDPELHPEREAEIRRMLVEARHEAPMPGDVAARLDRVLARLRDDDAQGTPGHGVATVTELAARRRRRVTSLLVAAAAVVVVGVSLGQVADLDVSSTSSDTAADSAGDSAGDSAADTGQASQSQAEAASPASSAAAEAYADQGQAFDGATPATIRSADFSADVAAVLSDTRAADQDQLSADLSASAATSPSASVPAADGPGSFECTSAPFGAGRLVPVLYDGDPAVLAFRPPTGDTQVVDLLQCGSGELLRSVTLPGS